MNKVLLSFDRLSFSKDALHINDMSMSVYQGEIYGIVCDRIEERTLFVSLFDGTSRINGGSIQFDYKTLTPLQFHQLLPYKFALILKKSALIQNMSVAENICLFNDSHKWIKQSFYEEVSRKLLLTYDVSLDVSKRVEELTEKERIFVELFRAVLMKKQLVIISGLASLLNLSEIDEIISFIKKIQEKEPITFLFIEVFGDLAFQHTDRILMVRHGICLGCFRPDFLNYQKLYRLLISQNTKSRKTDDSYSESSLPVIEFQNINTDKLNEISFTVSTGEIINVFCMDPATIDEFRNVFFGNIQPASGRIVLNNHPVIITDTTEMNKNKIVYCKERAYRTMLIPEMTARNNIMLELAWKMPRVWFSSKYKNSVDNLIKQWMEEDVCEKIVEELTLLQRHNLAYLKLYLKAPKVLVIESPLSDIDLYMKEATKSWIKQFLARGTAVIILTIHTQDLYEFDGEILYLMDGNIVEEDDIYQSLYNHLE